MKMANIREQYALHFIVIFNVIFCVLTFSSATTCPEKCICESIVNGYRVTCRNQNLQRIPEGIPNITTILNLDRNLIIVKERAFPDQLPLLTSLSLEENVIRAFHPMAFAFSTNNSSDASSYISAVPNLMELNLYNNILTIIPEINCDYVPFLNIINMGQNMVKSFAFPSNYSKCIKLEWINAVDNWANSIKDNDLLSLNTLNNLHLALGSGITSTALQSFEPIKNKLLALMLGRNPISYNCLQNISIALNGSTSLSVLGLNILLTVLNGTMNPPLEQLYLPNLTSLDLSSNHRWNYSVPFIGMPKLQIFSAQKSIDIVISDNFFSGFPTLQTLLLRESTLKRIPTNLPASLTKLDLYRSKLGDISSTNFSSMPNLIELDLGECQITRLNPLNFNLRKLQRFSLTYNKMNETMIYSTQSLFKDMDELRMLDLSHNGIRSLNSADIFPSSSKLEILKLNDQWRENSTDFAIHPDVFSKLISLQSLDLSYISYFGFYNDESGRIFSKLNKLKLLKLASTQLDHIPALLFKGTTSLESLELQSNLITSEALDNITYSLNSSALSMLNLNRNYIARVSSYTLHSWSNLPNLKIIDLSENPFECDSNILDFHGWLRNVTGNFTANDTVPESDNYSQQFTLVGYKSYKCGGPNQCGNILLIELGNRPDLCNPSLTTTIAATSTPSHPSPGGLPVWAIVLIVLASLLIIIAIIVTIGFYFWKKSEAQRNASAKQESAVIYKNNGYA